MEMTSVKIKITYQPLSPSVGGGWSGLQFAEPQLAGNIKKLPVPQLEEGGREVGGENTCSHMFVHTY